METFGNWKLFIIGSSGFLFILLAAATLRWIQKSVQTGIRNSILGWAVPPA